MARNLTRNTKLYVSDRAQVLTAGVVDISKVSKANTFEVKVLDGYSFSQATTTQDITISEAGDSPIRGQKTFNTAQEPVDVSISTYLRPYVNSQTLVDSPEKILWASLASSSIITNTVGDMVANVAGNGLGVLQTSTGMTIDFEESDSNTLATLVFWFKLENTVYRVDEVNISTAEIDFAIDGIATSKWSGKGTSVVELDATDISIIEGWVAGTDYIASPTTTSSSFLRNKLSTMVLYSSDISKATNSGTADTGSTTTTLVDAGTNALTAGAHVGDYLYVVDIGGGTADEARLITANTTDVFTVDSAFSTAPSSGDSWYVLPGYNIAITGGSLTIENNMDFLTPEELGVVNQPLPGFAGARAVSGSITAYLNTGSRGTAALLNDMLADINSVTNSYNFTLYVGGTAATSKRVDITLGTAQLSVPSVNVEDVIATEITFSGQGSAGAIENRDEVIVTYVAA